MRTVYTGGTFDLFHAGHVNFLRQCKAIAGDDGIVVVSLNTDEFVKKYKGNEPVYKFTERAFLVKGCRYVDEVISNTGGADSKPAILEVKPDFIVIATDWITRDYYKQMGFTQNWLDSHDIVLLYAPYTEGISTSELKERINKL